jgi:antitoxin HigA-1
MKDILNIIKGIHPGKFLERELSKRELNQRQFAIAINEHPQTLNAIIKGKRNMNIDLSLKIEKALNFDEGFLMTLQVFYDIKITNKKNQATPDLTKIRKVTFWDTTIDKIDWKLHKIFVIKRVFSYGNENEQREIVSFYGKDEVNRINELHPEKLTR